MGDDITIEYRTGAFGTGYNAFIFGETGNSAFTAASTSSANIQSDTPDTVTFDIAVATSVQELTQMLADHADASGAVMGVDVGLSAAALSTTTFIATDTYVVARVCIVNRIDALQQAGLALTDSAAALPLRQFVTTYGDRYVGEIHQGGVLTLVITVSSADLASKKTFDVAASAKSGTFDAGGVAIFQANLQSILHQQNIHIYLAHVGGAPPPSDVRDLNVVLKYALGFQGSALERPVAFEAVCFSYADVPDAPAGLEAFVLGPRANLESLVNAKLGYLDSHGSFEYVIANADALGIAEDQLKALEGDLNHLNKDIRLIDSSWRHSDVTTIPNAASLPVTNTPDGYQSIIDKLDVHAAARLAKGRAL